MVGATKPKAVTSNKKATAMAQIQIHDNDFLWKYYQKAHTLTTEDVPKPTNLCPYFWTAIFGMLASFWMEAKLWLVWMLNAIGVGACFYVFSVVKSMGDPPPIWAILVSMILFITTGASCLATLGFTGERLKGLWKKLYIGFGFSILATAVVGFLGFAFYIIGRDFYNWWNSPSSTPIDWALGLQVIGGMTLCIIGLCVAVGIVCFIWTMILNPMRSWRFLQNIWSMIKALKNGICPMTLAPPAFMAALEKRETLAKEKAEQEKQDGEPAPAAKG